MVQSGLLAASSSSTWRAALRPPISVVGITSPFFTIFIMVAVLLIDQLIDLLKAFSHKSQSYLLAIFNHLEGSTEAAHKCGWCQHFTSPEDQMAFGWLTSSSCGKHGAHSQGMSSSYMTNMSNLPPDLIALPPPFFSFPALNKNLGSRESVLKIT